jgi:hypothetical protein
MLIKVVVDVSYSHVSFIPREVRRALLAATMDDGHRLVISGFHTNCSIPVFDGTVKEFKEANTDNAVITQLENLARGDGSGGTRLYDTMVVECESPSPADILIVLTDDGENSSGKSLADAERALTNLPPDTQYYHVTNGNYKNAALLELIRKRPNCHHLKGDGPTKFPIQKTFHEVAKIFRLKQEVNHRNEMEFNGTCSDDARNTLLMNVMGTHTRTVNNFIALGGPETADVVNALEESYTRRLDRNLNLLDRVAAVNRQRAYVPPARRLANGVPAAVPPPDAYAPRAADAYLPVHPPVVAAYQSQVPSSDRAFTDIKNAFEIIQMVQKLNLGGDSKQQNEGKQQQQQQQEQLQMPAPPPYEASKATPVPAAVPCKPLLCISNIEKKVNKTAVQKFMEDFHIAALGGSVEGNGKVNWQKLKVAFKDEKAALVVQDILNGVRKQDMLDLFGAAAKVTYQFR